MRENYEQSFGKETVQRMIDGAPGAKKAIEAYRTALRTDLKGLLPDLEVGALAPESISVNLDGKTVKLSELKGKVVVLDFNEAYNPPCAFNPYTTCPIPLKENRLAVKILAGEKAYKGHE